jgi:hypothetical protein
VVEEAVVVALGDDELDFKSLFENVRNCVLVTWMNSGLLLHNDVYSYVPVCWLVVPIGAILVLKVQKL